MSDHLTVILPPVLSAEEREQEALEFCGGSLTAGNGWGCGSDEGWGNGYSDVWGDGYGDGYGWGNGDGESATHV